MITYNWLADNKINLFAAIEIIFGLGFVIFQVKNIFASVIVAGLLGVDYFIGTISNNESRKSISLACLVLAVYRIIVVISLGRSNMRAEYEKEICFRWGNKKVKEWLKKCKFSEEITSMIEQFDGKMLKNFYDVKLRSAEFYYNFLDKQTGSNAEEIMKFDIKLENLIQYSFQMERELKKFI